MDIADTHSTSADTPPVRAAGFLPRCLRMSIGAQPITIVGLGAFIGTSPPKASHCSSESAYETARTA